MQYKACQVMTNGDPNDGFFNPILARIMDYFSCSPLNTSFYIGKHEKVFLNTLRCDIHVIW